MNLAMPPASPEGRSPAALLLIVVLIHSAGVFCYSTLWRTIRAPDFDVNDFKAYYTGALALGEGRPDLLYPDPGTLNLGLLPDQPWVRFAMERGVPHPSAYIYPPFLAVVLRPLTLLPYHRANQVWFALNVVLFAASVALLVTMRPRGIPPEGAAAIVFVSLNFYPTFRAIQCGQVGPILLFLMAAALWALERGRDDLAGCAVALAAAVKITPAILVVLFLLARRYRAAAAAVAAGVGCLLLSIAGAGWANHEVFLRDFLPALSRGAATFANQSLTGALARLGTSVTMNAFEFLDEPAWFRAAERIGSLAILIASLWLGRRLALSRAGTGAAFGLVLLGTLLASPISWEHHFVMALIPLAVLVTALFESALPPIAGPAALIAGYVLLATNAYDLIRHHLPYLAGRIAISYATLGALTLWFLLAAGPGVDPAARGRAPSETAA